MSVTFQDTDLSTPPNGTVVETIAGSGGANRQVVDLASLGGGALSFPVTGTFFQAVQPVSESGTWTVQPGNTANTTPWLATVNQGGNSATVTASNALKVDGSAVTQPVSLTSTTITGTVAVTESGTWTVGQTKSATGTQTSVASSASSVTILASNANRLGATVYNDSTQILYLLLSTGGTASTTVYTVQLVSGAYFEVPFNYTGALIGIWAAANGNARVTENT